MAFYWHLLLKLVSVAEQAGMSLTSMKSVTTVFCRDGAHVARLTHAWIKREEQGSGPPWKSRSLGN